MFMADVFRQAEHHNRAHGVRAMLYQSDRFFAGLLEGTESALRATWDRVARSRHHFPLWSVNATHRPPSLARGLSFGVCDDTLLRQHRPDSVVGNWEAMLQRASAERLAIDLTFLARSIYPRSSGAAAERSA